MPSGSGLSEAQQVLVGVASLDVPLPFVVDVIQGDRVTLSAQRDGDRANTTRDLAAIREGEDLHVQYVDRFGVYDIDARVLECDHDTVVIGVESEARPVRRRIYVRLRAPLDAACLLLDPDRNTFTELDATVVDIGGGGAALAVPAIAPTGSTMVCSIALASGAPIVTVAHVLPPDADPRDQAERRHVRVQFTLIAEADRDRLLAFILDALARRAAS
jgi:c-di-GMP-binding flagellar brake protein YcgR